MHSYQVFVILLLTSSSYLFEISYWLPFFYKITMMLICMVSQLWAAMFFQNIC